MDRQYSLDGGFRGRMSLVSHSSRDPSWYEHNEWIAVLLPAHRQPLRNRAVWDAPVGLIAAALCSKMQSLLRLIQYYESNFRIIQQV